MIEGPELIHSLTVDSLLLAWDDSHKTVLGRASPTIRSSKVVTTDSRCAIGTHLHLMLTHRLMIPGLERVEIDGGIEPMPNSWHKRMVCSLYTFLLFAGKS